MHVLGILNQNVMFGYFQARTQNETWVEWAMGDPGEGTVGKRGTAPHFYTETSGKPAWERQGITLRTKSSHQDHLCYNLQPASRLSSPQKEPWVPRNVSPAISTQVSEPWVRGHEATGKTWEEKPWSSDSGLPGLQHQDRQLIPHSLQMVADKRQRLTCPWRDLTLREKLETTYL